MASGQGNILKLLILCRWLANSVRGDCASRGLELARRIRAARRRSELFERIWHMAENVLLAVTFTESRILSLSLLHSFIISHIMAGNRH